MSAPLVSSVCYAQQPDTAETLVIRNQCLVFWNFSSAEYDSLMSRMTFTLDSMETKFEASRSALLPFLKKIGIKPILTSASTFVFPGADSMQYRRPRYRDLFGVILYQPGKRPQIISGVTSDVDLIKLVTDYYEIRQRR